jgi:hypothetical protein
MRPATKKYSNIKGPSNKYSKISGLSVICYV